MGLLRNRLLLQILVVIGNKSGVFRGLRSNNWEFFIWVRIVCWRNRIELLLVVSALAESLSRLVLQFGVENSVV